jgi:hypothetical protein
MTQLDQIEGKLDRLRLRLKDMELSLYIINLQGRIEMALSQDILDAVNAETTVIDSFITLVQGLIDNNTIPPAAGQAILTALASNKAKVEAAILANTTPPTA